jgi:hypothetical protein
MQKQYLYFQALNGFTDILTSLRDILIYGEKYERIILFDTMNSFYKINFSDYFDLPQKNIIYDFNEIKKICNDDCDIYPSFIGRNMSQIIKGEMLFKYVKGIGSRYNDILIKLPEEKRPEKIIFIARGGGELRRRVDVGYIIFQTLSFKENVVSHVLYRYSQIKKPYLCIQVRNTDRKSDYIGLYKQNKDLLCSYNSIYLATDDINVLNYFTSKKLPVLNFTNFGNEKSKSLHTNMSVSPQVKILDLITDIYLIMMANEFLSNSFGGFILLLRKIREERDYIFPKFINELEDTNPILQSEKKEVNERRNFANLFKLIG